MPKAARGQSDVQGLLGLEACLENVCRNQAGYHVVQREVLVASSQVNGGSCDCNQDGGNVTGRQLCICDGVTGVIK